MTLTVKGRTVVKGSLRVGPWSPQSISGLQLWLDAADSSTVTLSGSNITTCTDKSGNAFVLSGISTPTYVSNVQNGKSVIRCGSAGYLKATNLALLKSVAGWSMFAVGKPGSVADYRFLAVVTGGAVADTRAIIDSRLTTGYWHTAGIRTDGDVLTELTTTTQASTSSFSQLTAVGNYGTSLTIWQNGAQIGQTLTFWAAGNTSNTNAAAVVVGAYHNGSYPFAGDIGEILVYNSALSTANRQLVESYLKAKWGTP